MVVRRTWPNVLPTIPLTRRILCPPPCRSNLNIVFLVRRTSLLILTPLLNVPARTLADICTSLWVIHPRVITPVRHLKRVVDVTPSASNDIQFMLLILLKALPSCNRLAMAQRLIGPLPAVRLATVSKTPLRVLPQKQLGPTTLDIMENVLPLSTTVFKISVLTLTVRGGICLKLTCSTLAPLLFSSDPCLSVTTQNMAPPLSRKNI